MKNISVRNPENITILTKNLMLEFNREIKAGIHGSLIKYVHGMANKHNINPINPQNNHNRIYEFNLEVIEPEVLRFKNCHVHQDMIVFDNKNRIIQTNLNSYYEWDDGFFPIRRLKPSKPIDLILKILKSCKILSKEKDFVLRKKVALKKHAKELFAKKNKIIEVENAIVFCDQYFYVFGHFMHENYPRLYFLLSQLTKEEKEEYKIILPPDSKAFYYSYIKPCLDALNIKENQVIYLEKDSLLKIKNLIMPSQMRFHPLVKESLDHLRNFYKDEDLDFKDYKKVYLSRKNAPRRKIINEEEVQEFLIKKGFKIVYIEDLDFKSQMNLLRNVKILLAQDSSTLTNVILCENCEHCLIFTCDKITCPLFGTVTENTKFYYQFCEPEDRANFDWWSSNIIIDINNLEENLEIIEKNYQLRLSSILKEKSFDNRVIEILDSNFVNKNFSDSIKSKDGLLNFYKSMGWHLMNYCGLPDEASEMFRSALQIRHDDATAIIYLQNLMYTSPENYDQQKILSITKEVMSKIANSEKKYNHTNHNLDDSRVLNIGYTCHFFDNTTSTTLLLPIIKNHDRSKVKIFVYSDQDPKNTKKSTREFADVWHDTLGLNDDDFCNLIINDKIDILLEINGFCLQNRYRAINMRPAPIQVSFYNISATSGVREMDYILVGEEVETTNLQRFYTEKFFHKKGIQLATEVGPHFPEVKNEIPYKKNGYITFGSFGQIHKVSRKQIFLWSKILKELPNSKFILKASALDKEECRSIYSHHFLDAKIDASRIIFEGHSEYSDLLNSYQKIDIALDTYPYGGGTTTIEALIQGTPVISLVGNSFCSQHGAINLSNINHKELLSYSEEEFVLKAVELAKNPEKIEFYRKNLRNSVINSSRGNIKKYTQELEEAYKEMFKIYKTEYDKKNI
jgi:predicted O-linked N-acetylglucosamine transferase (SPINDLY family)